MKGKVIIAAGLIFVAASCTQYSCPTYGSNYSYTPSKHKASRSSSGKKSKPIKRAEQ